MKEIIVKTTLAFDRKAKKLLTSQSTEELFDYLTNYPEKGDIIQRTSGVRNLGGKLVKEIELKVAVCEFYITTQKNCWLF